MKFACLIGIFLNTTNLICRSTDISKCFRGSLRFRDNESRLYFFFGFFSEVTLQAVALQMMKADEETTHPSRATCLPVHSNVATWVFLKSTNLATAVKL